MRFVRSPSRLTLFFLVFALAFAALEAACATSKGQDGYTTDPDASDATTTPPPDGAPPESDGAPFGGDDAQTGPLVIDPIPTIQVAIDVTASTKTITPPQVTLTAGVGGAKVPATWTIDRGELGALTNASGLFVANGVIGGVATVTASYAGKKATAPLTVAIHAKQNGGPPAGADAGAGGFGGVGGEGPGGALPDPTIVTRLQTEPATPNPDSAAMQWLYPYDGTVWPRGLLPPLLQWQTDPGHVADAVYIHLKEANYEFEGFYSLSGSLSARARQPIDASVWTAATGSNGGKSDPLVVELKIFAAGSVYGPIHESWSVAQGVLQGTVYYNSYYSSLNTESSGVNVVQGYTGAVVAIQPRSPNPVLAVSSLHGHCNVCHAVAADGRTLFTQNDERSTNDLDYGASYDMSDGGAPIRKYYDNNADGGTSNAGKFTFAAPYPDGTFVMANTGHNYHTFGGPSALFARDTANELLSIGWKDKVTSAVTPAFSPEGRKIAFTFWDGPGANGVAATQGHSIAVMDFDCGAAAGQVTCGNATPSFSGLREIFGKSIDNNSSHYVGWPSFTPDGSALLFQRTLAPSSDWPLNTSHGAKAEIWYSDVPAAGGATARPRLLCALNGYSPGCNINPKRSIPDHTSGTTSYDDTALNYEPNANPVSSGGYYWVVFTSRRRYGNVAAGDPYAGSEGNPPTAGSDPFAKKLWVAAIDVNATPNDDPSHPAFYLPGQELRAGNMRGFWSVDPCHANGATCETGEECCGGFCHDDGSGKLVCSDKPAGCSNEFEKCTTDADCCGTSLRCINGRCALGTPK